MPGHRPITTAMLSVGAAVVVATPTPARADFTEDRAVLLAPATTDADRDAAAVRLVAADTPGSRAVLIDALSRPVAQLPVARAMQVTPTPNADAVAPLVKLLGPNQPLSKAAAVAIAGQDSPAALAALQTFIREPKNPNRADVIRALGGRSDQSTAEFLVQIATTKSNPTALLTAADAALSAMTGYPQNSEDPQRWATWWFQFGRYTPDEFRARLLQGLRQHTGPAADQIKILYRMIPKPDVNRAPGPKAVADRDDALLTLLKDPDPATRLTGTDLAREEFNSRVVGEPVKEQIRTMISDGDGLVRLDAVAALAQSKDSAAAPKLVEQLVIEKDPQIRARITETVANLAGFNAATINSLMGMVTGTRPDLATAAARALSGKIGESFRTADQPGANADSQILRGIFQAHPNPLQSPDAYRAAIVSATATLADPASFGLYQAILQNPGESEEVREQALRGFGQLGDKRANVLVAAELEDNSAVVRLYAAMAFKTIATVNDADYLYTRMMFPGPKAEPDRDVRDAEWAAFQALFKDQSVKTLRNFAAQFSAAKDFPKRLTTLIALGEKLEAARQDEDVALNRLDIAQTLMLLTPPRPHEAVENLKKSMDFWNGPGGGGAANNGMRMEALWTQLIADEVADHQYGAAVDFAAQQIKADGGNNRIVSNALRDAVHAALDNDKPGVVSMVLLIRKMNPKLLPGAVDQIEADGQQAGAPP